MSDDRDYETEAKVDGWVPQAEWKGDPAKWIAAEEFVKRGESILPILNAKLRKERERTEALERQMQERETVFNEFRTFQDQALEKAKKDREDAISQLEAERKKAITEGDGDAFAKADNKLQELRAQPVKPPERKENPEVSAWKSENAWYGTDLEATAVADGLSDVVARENPGLKGKAFLDKLSERVRKVIPHKFENARREEQITTSAQRKGSQKGKTYENLPEDAQAACDRFCKTIRGFTVEKYLSTYRWES